MSKNLSRRGEPLKSALDDEVVNLHAQGKSQGEIAKHLGVARWQVRQSGIRKDLTWDTTASAHAFKAAQTVAQRQRAELTVRLGDHANDLLDQIEGEGEQSTRQGLTIELGITLDKWRYLYASSVHDATDDGMGEIREQMALLVATMDQSMRARQLAERLGATPEQLMEIDRGAPTPDE